MDRVVTSALATDTTVDITTIGRRSGKPRRIEIWFRRVADETFITGTPGPRGWYANLLLTPEFVFHFKESIRCDYRAVAHPVVDARRRRELFSDPAMSWYRERAGLEELVRGGPLVQVTFLERVEEGWGSVPAEKNSHELTVAGGSD